MDPSRLLDLCEMAEEIKKDREWRRVTEHGEYLISTKISNFNLDWINEAFAHEDTYWAKPLPKALIALMLSKSITLGLYKVNPTVPAAATLDSPSSPRTPSPTLAAQPEEQLQQIGIARWMTDFVTSAYLTDVYCEREYRSQGLGKWLIACCKEVEDSIPALRRGFLLTDKIVGKRFYSRELGYWDMHDEHEHVVMMTRRMWKLPSEQ